MDIIDEITWLLLIDSWDKIITKIITDLIPEHIKEKNKKINYLLENGNKKNTFLKEVFGWNEWVVKYIDIGYAVEDGFFLLKKYFEEIAKIEYQEAIKKWINDDDFYRYTEYRDKIRDYFCKINESDNIEHTINSFFKLKDQTSWWMLWDCSPYSVLDSYTMWIPKSKVITIWWYSNVWKSKFAYTYVNHFLKIGKKVLFFSLEVDRGMLFANILSQYFWTEFKNVFDLDFDPEKFKNLIIYDDVYKMEKIQEITKASDADYVFIDFVQNVRGQGASIYEKIANIAVDIQQLAITTGKTIFSISQVNNDSRFKQWEQAQLKWGWELFASSDIIFLLWKEKEEMFITIQKNKFWPAWVTKSLDVDLSKWQFAVWDDLSF